MDEQSAPAEAQNKPSEIEMLLERMKNELNVLGKAFDELETKLQPIVLPETEATHDVETVAEPRTVLGRHIREHLSRIETMTYKVNNLSKRIEI